MATNEILRFAETDNGTNLLTQAEYLDDSQRPIGNQPGVARSKLVNKALRQATLIAAGLAEYIADNQANNITDALTPQNIADYLQAAITGALGVTPPQFDNDTSLATTAFVQRALGNSRTTLSVSSNLTLSGAEAGAEIVFGANNVTLTLPDSSSFQAGAAYFIDVGSASGITLASTGSQILRLNNVDTLSSTKRASISLGQMSTFKVVNLGGGTWGVSEYGGLASLSSQGYQRLPSGLIVQWALGANQEASGNQTITFPIAFPTGHLRTLVTNVYSSSSQSGGYAFISATTSSVTVARNTLDTVNGVTPTILAFGY